MIRLTALSKRYGSFTAVNGIDLSVPRGELFGFLGPNGAGKTTTLRMIAGILRPTAGRIEIAGIDIVVDPKAAKILKDLFREYTRRGHTIMMSTHTLEVAQALCDRIAIIQGGKIRACGTMEELRRDADAGATGLEHIFLKLTGENAARELVEVLDA